MIFSCQPTCLRITIVFASFSVHDDRAPSFRLLYFVQYLDGFYCPKSRSSCTIARRDEYSRKTHCRQRLLFVFFFFCENPTLHKLHKFRRLTCHDSVHVTEATSACTLLPYTQVCVLSAWRRNKNDRVEQSHRLIFSEINNYVNIYI